MAVPALLQSASASSALPNPTLAFPKRVSAGSLLVIATIQKQSPVIGPAPVSDGHNAYQMANAAANYTGLCACTCYATNLVAGPLIIAFPLQAPCAYAIHEFSGVLTTSDPIDDAGAGIITETSITVNYDWNQIGELVFGCALALGNVTFTLPSGISIAQQLSSANGSLVTAWGTAPSVQAGTQVWAQSGLSGSSTAALWSTYKHN